jgi:hypothetical protein
LTIGLEKKIVEHTITCEKHKPKRITWCEQKANEGATKSQQKYDFAPNLPVEEPE